MAKRKSPDLFDNLDAASGGDGRDAAVRGATGLASHG